MKNIKLRTLKDAYIKAESTVEIDDTFVSMNSGRYRIDLNEFKNAMDIVNWTHHLCEKSWIERATISEFIEKLCRYIGKKLYVD